MAAATDHTSIGRSILSFRREQVHPMDGQHEDPELASFQRQVAALFHDLAGGGGAVAAPVLSVDWIKKLLDSFLICQEEFRILLFNRSGLLSRAPLDRLMSEFSDRAIRSLDVLNAVRDGVGELRQWRSHLEIVLAALGGRSLGQGQLRRARKALAELSFLVLDEKDATLLPQHRNRSFGRGGGGRADSHRHFRSLSCSVARSWSASRQLQAIGNNLAAPRANDVAASHGLANPIYTMSSVLQFVMWALVAAIPCQDRGIQAHLSVPRNFPWAAPVMSLHERIMEESRKKDRKHSRGLLAEIHQIERCTRRLTELIGEDEFQLTGEKDAEVRKVVDELAQVYDVLKGELDPLERQVREVFQRIVRSRTEHL